jgi:hypothetical protein
MSILERIKKSAPPPKGLFAVVAGCRLAGKSSLAGTLPGKTIMLQATVLESGSESAKAMAARNKHELTVLNFNTVDELNAIIKELEVDETFNNVYVDGLSAITELLTVQPKIAVVMKGNVWEGYRLLGEQATDIILALKKLTYGEKAKNVFLTCAMKVKSDNGTVDVELETRGRMAVTAVTKYGEAVLTMLPPQRTETGETGYRLLTRSDEIWPGRIDGLLRDENPGIIEPADLSTVLALRNNLKKGNK